MDLNSLSKLVEVKTKVTTTFSFILGTLYTLYKFEKFDVLNAILLFMGIIFIDLCTTAINNYMDYVKAKKREGYGFEEHNVLGSGRISVEQARIVILVTLLIATVSGVLLVARTNIIVLLIGMISFLVGLTYTYGPLPISRTPLGEPISGIFQGFVVILLSIFVHVDADLMSLVFFGSEFIFKGNFKELLRIFVLSIPATLSISGIMLANNISDMEDDFVNHRFTLPIIMGKRNALNLFALLYIASFISVILMLFLKILPLVGIIMIAVFYVVLKNSKAFIKNPIKKETFILSVKNLVIIQMGLIITILMGMLFKL